jgi:hypothetical protein
MNKKIKSVALSALVLPGLGQLYLGRRVKGGVMILLDNLFILAGLFIGLRSAGKLMLASKVGTVDPEQVLAGIKADNPYATWVLGGFLVLWVYGVVDALMDQGGDSGQQ